MALLKMLKSNSSAAQHPDIQASAQEEVDRVLGDSQVVTSAMEKELKYVANCIKESQRLVPVITGFSRGAVEDAELGGIDQRMACAKNLTLN